MTEKTETVVITGFGPFAEFKVNASWEAVKALMKMPKVKELPVKLVATEVPVSYDNVLEKVPELYAKENPILMIHVGVSWAAQKITLEKHAYKGGYSRIDVNGKVPDGECCAVGCEPCVPTALDVDAMVEEFNKSDCGLVACTSKAAGRYVCEFIYYRSLHENNRRCLFVHVPDLNKPYSAEQLGKGLYKVVCLALKQLSENELADGNLIDEKKGALAL